MAFKGDLYILSHSKVLDISTTTTETATVSTAESYIFESQPQDDRGKVDVSKSFEMASYLEPYKGFAFTEDFTSELQVLPNKKGKESWRLAIAPSEVYCSPCTSEGSLKIFDFLLQPVTPNLEEQDKEKMSRKMIVTKDMKYVPGPKSAPLTESEIPFFGVSPCSSLVHGESRIKTQPEEQISEAVIEASTVEPLPESLHEKQHPISEETSPELPEVMPENATTSIKTKTSEPLSGIDSDVYEKEEERYPSRERQTRSIKFGTWSSRLEGKAAPLDSIEVQEIKTFSERHISREHIRKKLRMEKMVLKRMQTPTRAKRISVPKSATQSREVKYTSDARSPQSVISVAGQKVSPALGTEGLVPAEKRPLSGKKTKQKEKEHYESPYERAVTWRRKQNERIWQAEERRLMLELNRRPCSRNHCSTPTNSEQYLDLQSSEVIPETLLAFMKPYKQNHSRPYTVMEETTIKLPRDFPYRLAWGTPTTPDLGIKLYCPKMKLSKEHKISGLPVEKKLEPTKSIPVKGRYILVTNPVSAPSTPPMSPLESKLLSARFPKMKEKILHSLLSDIQESC